MRTEKTSATLRSLRGFLNSLAFGPPGSVDDARLLDRFLARRSEAEETARAADRAFEALVARHGPMVERICRQVLDDPSDVDDAFQATFLVLFRRAASVRAEGSLGPWLCGVARRIALRARSDRARRADRESRHTSPRNGEPAADASRAEIHSIIDEEVGRLPARYRAPVTLCLLEGLSYAEAARRLACPVGTLGVRLARGREMLRGRLIRRGVTSAAAAAVLTVRPGRAAAICPVRTGLPGGVDTSPRVFALARKELAVMLGWKARTVLAFVAAAVVLGGGVALVAGHRDRPAPLEPEAVPVARAESESPAPTDADPDARADAGELVGNQEATLKRIQSLTYVSDMRVSEDGEKTWKTMVRFKVARNGPVERVHTQSFWIRDRDKIVPNNSLSDALLSPDGVFSMTGYDPDHPPREPVTPIDQSVGGGRISAAILPAQPFGPWGYKGARAADYLALFLPDPRYSLRELRQATANVVPTGRRDAQGQMLWDLALKSPDGKADYVVTLSSAHGYAIAETRFTQVDGARTLKRVDRVLEFQEPAPGIFLPKRIRETMSWAPALVLETVISDVAVNTPVGDRDIALRFPEGIGVGDMGKKVWYVWGKDAPARTFKTAQEYNEWTRSQLDRNLAVPQTSAGETAAAGRYGDLVREFEISAADYTRALRGAKSDADRQDVGRRLRPDTAAFAARFLEVARSDPATPAALPALTRAATLSRSRVTEEAVDLLRKNWSASPDVAAVVLPVGLSASLSPATDRFLREVLARNPSREARGHAAYALASLLYSSSEPHSSHGHGPAEAGAMRREAEGLMTRVESEFADVKLHLDRPKDTQTLGGLARAWLGREDEPVIGRPAPAIEGNDLNGQVLRLSDFRGKVVVVVFWAGWCRPCLAMLPEEKALVRRLADKPFALIGVNCDATAAEARKLAAEKSVSWPNLHDGLPTEGKVAERYRVAGHGIPAIFVIDREGILRHKWIAASGELDKAVDALLAEAATGRK
jgi:RNA polymerase sigma factor (sigma-70 family)